MKQHVVAIFGGAVSGAEAAHQLAERGIRAIVFEQNALPYGKIEDGLPKWHAKLRNKEEGNIDEKLDHPLVTFVPNVKLGKDISFEDVAKNWGFSAIFLATGAWRDRPLQIDGIDEFINNGLYYQNQFINWYNHCHEPEYQGLHVNISDNALVVGGGLASIDIVKALMMETVQKALEERGHSCHLFDLERGIPKALESFNLKFEELGLKGCTLVYRRNIKDMPLFPGETDTPEKLAKAESVREKVLQTAQARFLFNVLPCHFPVDMVVENGQLAGLILRETKVSNGNVEEIPGTDKVFRTTMVVSSIGSVPETIPEVPARGQVFDVEVDQFCKLKGYDNVFAVGNAVTGRGNIKESLEHGRNVSQSVLEQYLIETPGTISTQYRTKETLISEGLDKLFDSFSNFTPPSPGTTELIFEKVKQLQSNSGYDGNYREWIKNHLPPRLEDLLGVGGH